MGVAPLVRVYGWELASQISTLPSSLATASLFSGLNARDVTGDFGAAFRKLNDQRETEFSGVLGPSSVRVGDDDDRSFSFSSLIVVKSQNRTFPSCPAVARRLLSRVNAIPSTLPLCESWIGSASASLGFHTLTV